MKDELKICYGNSEAWEKAAQANFDEACRHKIAAEALWLALEAYRGLGARHVLEKYKEYRIC